MKFIYTEGPYREYRGYMFWNGKPVTVTDRGTLEAIRRDPSFKEVQDAVRKEEVPQAHAPQVARPMLDPDACAKCGRIVRQGRYMHEKYCKGGQ